MATERSKMAVAVHLILRNNNQLLLLKRANTGYEDGKWSLPAGHIDSGESAIAAIMREAYEELGITLHCDNLQFAHTLHKCDPVDGQERIDLFFECRKWEGEVQNLEPRKCAELSWHPIDAMPGNVIGYIDHSLKAIFEKRLQFSEFGWQVSRASNTVCGTT